MNWIVISIKNDELRFEKRNKIKCETVNIFGKCFEKDVRCAARDIRNVFEENKNSIIWLYDRKAMKVHIDIINIISIYYSYVIVIDELVNKK